MAPLVCGPAQAAHRAPACALERPAPGGRAAAGAPLAAGHSRGAGALGALFASSGVGGSGSSSSSSISSSSRSSRRGAPPPPARAQALGSRDGDADDAAGPPPALRPVARFSAAGPLRVLAPLREASAALGGTLATLADGGLAGRGRSGSTLDDVAAPVAADMEVCRRALVDVVGKRHPLLRAAADQIFSAGGKRLRPLIVLLAARATAPAAGLPDITARHRRLAEITEMIHTASLVHDDVLDECDTRRGAPTVNASYGTRVAVLVGDFLFAQSSWFLAQLDDLEVIRLISQVIADFADGEISQAAAAFDADGASLEAYIDKSFYKTASLIAASCRGAAVFSGCGEAEKAAMYAYGRHLGLAFQIVDDVLDFTQTAAQLGKPQGQDLAAGNLTAPALYALADPRAGPRLRALLRGRLKGAGDLAAALELVAEGRGVERARALAAEEGAAARAALGALPPSAARDSLALMVDYVLDRLY